MSSVGVGGIAGSELSPKSDVVILVHGTFARGAEWTRNDRPLAEAIRARVPDANVIGFDWSGSNSPSARIQAGRELADLGNDLIHKGAKNIWLVAHSHGGNVSLFALRNESFREKVSGICFFGTPFFSVERRNIERISSIITKTASWLVAFPIYIPLIASFLLSALSNFSDLLAGFMLIFGNAIVLGTYLWFRSRLQKWICAKLIASLKRRQDETLEWLSQPSPQCRVLIASTARDEAGILLWSIDQITLFPWLIFSFATRIVLGIALGALLFMPVAMIAFGDTYSELDSSGYIILFVLGVPFFVVLAAPIIALLVSGVRGAPIAFGYEGLIGAATLRISPCELPTWYQAGDCQHLKHKPAPGLRGLRHSSFYNDPHVILACANWIAGEKGSRQTTNSEERPMYYSQKVRHDWFVTAIAGSFVVAAMYIDTAKRRDSVAVPRVDAALIERVSDYDTPSRELFYQMSYLLPERRKKEMFDFPTPGYMNVALGDSEIPPGTHCVVEGQFQLRNWDTTVRISSHLVERQPQYNRDPSSSYSSVFGGEIWQWHSKNGINVSFSRQFFNAHDQPLSLRVMFWNGSRESAQTSGEIRARCATRSGASNG